MKIVCVGGGPAGLYFSILARLRNPEHDVTVLERNPAGVTYGWGVVFWDDLLDNLYRSDPETARRIRGSSVRWEDQHVHVGGARPAYLAGYGFSMGRKRLLDILAERAGGLGVEIVFEHEVGEPYTFADADLIVACDGVHSGLRQQATDHFQTTVETGRNKFIWLGTHRIFDSFTFAFEQTAAGWIWFHAYHFDQETSTCIVECPPQTWLGLGFDQLGPDESTKVLEDIFASYLSGHSLINQMRGLGKTPWQNFTWIANGSWHRDNVVLMGDAAHTTHFTIGSGTKLAIEDAIGLVDSLSAHDDLRAALEAYERQRRPPVLALQKEARTSARWFEDAERYIDQDPVRFSYALCQRRAQETAPHGLSWRDPRLRYQLHLATQQPALRSVRRGVTMARGWRREWQRDRRRG